MEKVTVQQAADALGMLKAEAARLRIQLKAVEDLIERLTPAEAADIVNESRASREPK